jgi:hypothetical protein
MLDAIAILELVQNDVIFGLGSIFTPTGAGFGPLGVGEFDFVFPDPPNHPRSDIRTLDSADDNEQISCVAWSYEAIHDGPLVGVPGFSYEGEAIPVLDPAPLAQLPDGNSPPAMLPTNRPVLIAGVTLVVARNEEQEKSPMLLRFVDWVDVFSQLGFPISTRPTEPGSLGFQRIQNVVP